MVLANVQATTLARVVVNHMVTLKKQDTVLVVADHMVPLERQDTMLVVADHMVPLKRQDTMLVVADHIWYHSRGRLQCWRQEWW